MQAITPRVSRYHHGASDHGGRDYGCHARCHDGDHGCRARGHGGDHGCRARACCHGDDDDDLGSCVGGRDFHAHNHDGDDDHGDLNLMCFVIDMFDLNSCWHVHFYNDDPLLL